MDQKKTQSKKSFLSGIPSWGLALLTLVVAFTPFMYMAEEFTRHGELNGIGVIILIIYYLLLIFSCFFIVKQNPGSIWYAPLICNVFTIGMAFSGDFWATGLWKLLGGEFVLSIIASIIALIYGKRKSDSAPSKNANDLRTN